MCGVIGVVALGELKNKKAEEMRQEAMRLIATNLLFVTQERGKDATGISTMFSDGNYMLLKMGVSSPDFITRWGKAETDYDGYLKIWEEYTKPAKICIGHCRKASIGDVYNNSNNHPIVSGDIIGVHNGTLKNHKKILRLLDVKPDGDVDSEAIIRLIKHYTEDGSRPFSIEIGQEICKRIEGGYAVMAYSGNNPHQLLTFRDGRPMEMALVRPLNIIIIASEKKFINSALFEWNKCAVLYGSGKHRGWPMIKADDLDWLFMQDQSIAIYDLRHTVDSKKEKLNGTVIRIEDFMTMAKIPSTGKMWEVGDTTTTTTYYGRNMTSVVQNNTQTYIPEPPTAAVKPDKTNTTVESKSDVCKNSGKIFCRAMNSYVPINPLQNPDEVGSVEMDLTDVISIVRDAETNETLKTKAESSDTSEEITLTQGTEDIEELIDDPSTIREIVVDNILESNIEVTKNTHKEVTKVDMTVDAKAIELSEAVVEKLERFENNQEVADLFEASASSLTSLPLFGLANKLKKVFFKKGFLSGFRAGKECNVEVVTNVKELKTSLNQRKNIHVLKSLSKTLARLLGDDVADNKISEAVEETFRRGERMESQPLERIFSIGDYREQNTGRIISRVIDNLKSREEHK